MWCLRKARLFLLGCPNLVLIAGHRPLVKLFGDKALKDIANPRLLRLKEKTLQYQFHLRYLPGKKNCAADTLSRYPVLKEYPDGEDVEQEEEMAAAMIAATLAALDAVEGVVLDHTSLVRATASDPTYQMLMNRVRAGDWPTSRAQELYNLKPFYNVRDRLTADGEVVTYTFEQGNVKLVIPESLRQQVATNLHSGHQGVQSMLRRARQAVYWPGLEADLTHHRSQCETCNTFAPSQHPEPLIMTPLSASSS